MLLEILSLPTTSIHIHIPIGAIAIGRARFGPGTGPIYLDNVICSGRERELLDCLHLGVGINNCQHTEDAAVFCQRKPVGGGGTTRFQRIATYSVGFRNMMQILC